MPTYSFKNNETGEEYDLFMGISEAEEYRQANPHVTQLLASPKIVSGRDSKPAHGFRDLLNHFKKFYPGNNINSY